MAEISTQPKMAKVKKVKMSSSNDLADMFNQMLGGGDVDMRIAYPKYRRMRGLSEQIISVVKMLATSPFMKKYGGSSTAGVKGEYADECAALLEWCETSTGAVERIFSADFSDYEWNFSLVEDEQRGEFSELYRSVKESPLIKSFIFMCDRLVVYKKEMKDEVGHLGKFIDLMPGVSWTPLPFSTLNIKYIFAQHSDDITRRFFLVVLSKLYELSYKVWQEVTSPDIDMDEFSTTILDSINQVRKMPELSRCERAFRKIEESVDMLKDRFGSYYRDFIQTKNSSIIMEHFILDVSREGNTDVEMTRQFRQIIKFYRKNAAATVKDPKIKELFERVNSSFSQMEKEASNLVNIRDDDDGEVAMTPRAKKEVEAVVDPMHEYTAARETAATKSVDELAAEIENLKP